MKSSSCLGLTYKFYFWLILTDYSLPLLTFGREGEHLSMCTIMATFYSYLLVFHCLSLVHGQLQVEINRASSLAIDDSFGLPRNTTECLASSETIPSLRASNIVLLRNVSPVGVHVFCSKRDPGHCFSNRAILAWRSAWLVADQVI